MQQINLEKGKLAQSPANQTQELLVKQLKELAEAFCHIEQVRISLNLKVFSIKYLDKAQASPEHL